MSQEPILYSFRRCPYAMRARLALLASGEKVELREILLREKAAEFLETSPTGTVPCLKLENKVLDESLKIMAWALMRNDPNKWMQMPADGYEIMAKCDGPFKSALDLTKYATRYPQEDPLENRQLASEFLYELEEQLSPNLFGDGYKLADIAVLPFVRQFAHIDIQWFEQQPWPKVIRWLNEFKNSDLFLQIMKKYDVWKSGDMPIYFPS